MSNESASPRRKIYRRATAFPARLSFPASDELYDALNAEADAAGESVAAVARDALTRGLPLVRDARRKRKRQARRSGSGSDAGQ